jgi:quercetin dioxygenase-like cupin family protein
MTGERGGIILGPGQGPRATVGNTAGPATGTILIRAGAEDTHGAYALREATIAAAQPAVIPHVHHAMEEAFYVLEGQVRFQLGERAATMDTGSFVLVPRGVLHTFSNPTNQPARCLLLFSPPGFERYFEELAELRAARPGGQLEPAELAALAAKYGTEYFDVPPRA